MNRLSRFLLAECLCLAGILSARAATAEEAAQVFGQFKKLKLPCDSAQAHRIFGKAAWLDSSGVHRLDFLAGAMLISLDRGGQVYTVLLVPATPATAAWWIELRTTEDIKTVADLRDFFRGKAPAKARLVEYVCASKGLLERAGSANTVSK